MLSQRTTGHGLVALAMVLAVVGLIAPRSLAQLEAEASPKKRDDLFAELEKTLSGATLVGHHTDSAKQTAEPVPERYEIAQLRHLEDDQWLISARIRYGEFDVTVPLRLPIRWAGDTPVISLDDLTVPGLGTYSARVVIYKDHYAGFWSGEDHGGHLFGVIERNAAPAEKEAD